MAAGKTKPKGTARIALNAAVPTSTGKIWRAALIIVLAGLAAYSNSFHGPFILDDAGSITGNPTIRHGWLAALQPTETGEPVTGRPLVNLSLALNYELGGSAVEGYHAVNLVIHLLAGLTLFGLVRRTLELPSMRDAFDHYKVPVALSVGLLWTVHPLQTESVTYMAQRAESLMGLFYLLTLYCFVRGEQSARTVWWQALGVLACLFGGLSKEVAVTIPVLVLLYDRTFLAGTFIEAWRRRPGWYLALACTWIPLGLEVWHVGTRGHTAGFGVGVSCWQYAYVQIRAIIIYLGLSIWPHPLALDYGTDFVHQTNAVWPYVPGLALLLGGTLYALWRRPKWGFMGAWFFVILAPSSSVVPVVTEQMAEHRMYLPLAAVLALAVGAMFSWGGRRAYGLVAVLTIAWGGLTFERNHQYQWPTEFLRRDVAAEPTNSRAHYNLATTLIHADRALESIQEFRMAVAFDPTNSIRENALGLALAMTGQPEEALPHYRRAVDLQPDFAGAHVNLGNLLKQTGHVPEAIAEYLQALRKVPDSAEVRTSLGTAYHAAGQPEQALAYYQSAVARNPDLEQAHAGLGNMWVEFGRREDAVKEYDIALQLNPGDYFARYSLGEVMITLNKVDEARYAFSEVLREHPDFAPARNALDALPPADAEPGSAPVTK